MLRRHRICTGPSHFEIPKEIWELAAFRKTEQIPVEIWERIFRRLWPCCWLSIRVVSRSLGALATKLFFERTDLRNYSSGTAISFMQIAANPQSNVSNFVLRLSFALQAHSYTLGMVRTMTAGFKAVSNVLVVLKLETGYSMPNVTSAILATVHFLRLSEFHFKGDFTMAVKSFLTRHHSTLEKVRLEKPDPELGDFLSFKLPVPADSPHHDDLSSQHTPLHCVSFNVLRHATAHGEAILFLITNGLPMFSSCYLLAESSANTLSLIRDMTSSIGPAIRGFKVEVFGFGEDTFDALSQACPNLEVLDVFCQTEEHLGHSVSSLTTKINVSKVLTACARLRNLRTLVWSSAPRMFGLGERGWPFLLKLCETNVDLCFASFPDSGTWRRSSVTGPWIPYFFDLTQVRRRSGGASWLRQAILQGSYSSLSDFLTLMEDRLSEQRHATAPLLRSGHREGSVSNAKRIIATFRRYQAGEQGKTEQDVIALLKAAKWLKVFETF